MLHKQFGIPIRNSPELRLTFRQRQPRSGLPHVGCIPARCSHYVGSLHGHLGWNDTIQNGHAERR